MNTAIRKIFFSFLFCVLVWLGGLVWFVMQIPDTSSGDNRHTDAIVALTGGSNRLEYGLELLANGKADRIFISGVHDTLTPESMIKHASPSLREKLEALPEGSIVLGHEAENTIGNAEETSRWIRQQGYKSIRLVTSNYHMPRSLEEFTQLLPGVEIIPDPVLPDGYTPGGWWRHGELRILVLLEYHKLIASKLRHWFVSVTHHA